MSALPPAQGGIQILGRAEAVDVEYVEVPMVVFQLFHRDRYAQCKTVQKIGDSPGAVLGSVGTRPLLYNDRLVGFDSAENCGRSASTVL